MGNSQTIVLELVNGTNGQSVYPGTYLQGTLHINVPNGVEIGREGIHLALWGQERARWSETHGGGKNKQTKRYDVRSPIIQTQRYQMEGAFDSRKIRGQYSVPFTFLVPATDLPPTFAAPFKNGRCSVNYKLCAELHVSGMMKRNLRHAVQIFIAPRPPPNLGELLQPSQTHGEKDVMYCCCFNKGQIALTAQLGRRIFEARETIVPLLTFQNDSTSDVNSLRIRVEQQIHVPRRNRYSTRRLADVKVDHKFEAESGATKPFTANVGINIPTSQLSFNGDAIKCRYMMHIEADVPMAPDLKLTLPLQITAPGSLANVFNQQQQLQQQQPMVVAGPAPGSMMENKVTPLLGHGEMKTDLPPPGYPAGGQQGGDIPLNIAPNAPPPEYGDIPPPPYDEVGYDSDDEDAKQPAAFNPSAPPPGWEPQKMEPINWDKIVEKPHQ